MITVAPFSEKNLDNSRPIPDVHPSKKGHCDEKYDDMLPVIIKTLPSWMGILKCNFLAKFCSNRPTESIKDTESRLKNRGRSCLEHQRKWSTKDQEDIVRLLASVSWFWVARAITLDSVFNHNESETRNFYTNTSMYSQDFQNFKKMRCRSVGDERSPY